LRYSISPLAAAASAVMTLVTVVEIAVVGWLWDRLR
jgi:hypothetical protein